MTFKGPFEPKPFHDSNKSYGEEAGQCLSYFFFFAIEEVFYLSGSLVWFRPAEVWTSLCASHPPCTQQHDPYKEGLIPTVSPVSRSGNLLPGPFCSLLIQANPLSLYLLLFLPLPWSKKVRLKERKGSYGNTL